MKQHLKYENNMRRKHGIKYNIHHHETINVFAYHVGFQVKYHYWQFIEHFGRIIWCENKLFECFS